MQYFTVTVFTVFRPCAYTVVATFMAHMFSFRWFGLLYGLLFVISAIFNCLQYLLSYVVSKDGSKYAQHAYFAIDVSLAVICVLGATPLPVYMLLKNWPNASSQRHRRLSAKTDLPGGDDHVDEFGERTPILRAP